MPKLGPLQIDDQILDAIRDDRLVIFAGAGISMGPPANLPNFSNLASVIAAGSDIKCAENEPIDRFLGRLAHQKIPVHQRAVQGLNIPNCSPTALHVELLRLFRSADRVRLVTTNFDLLFEAAALTVFDGTDLETFRAPALPLGHDFRGLVHLHGALTRPQEMVLTDADFGRSYLTEGWARRFLVDVFRTYTVLFVGYSHDDVVMNYLARALPVDGTTKRYALTEDDGKWNLLGIEPILFCISQDENKYRELYDGIRCLAERVTLGVLGWQSELSQIGGRIPPIDDEAIGKIEQGLKEVHTTRFLIDMARLPQWPKWLNARKYLDTLFNPAPLTERDKLLAEWLAKHFAIDYADEVIGLIAAHNMRLNPELWWNIGRELGLDNEKSLDDVALSRWIPILLATAPDYADSHVLTWLAERCIKQNNIKMALEVFLYIGSHCLIVKPRFDWADDENGHNTTRIEAQTPLRSKHYELNKVWEHQIKPNLAVIAQPLLSGIVRHLEESHHMRLAWNMAEGSFDSESWRRSAIEPHEQDRYPEALDVLIDAGRDTLEWFAIHQSKLLDAWMEQLIISDVPLLRRLAIHALTVHTDKSADDLLNWLIARVELHSLAERHEIHRAVSLVYLKANKETRQTVIDAVLRHQLPDNDKWSATERTARAHFDWLEWLHRADPTCELVQIALEPIKYAYPEWLPKEYPDLTHWISVGWRGSRSPWTVEELLAKSPTEQLENLLNFQGDKFRDPDREGLLSAIQEACKQQAAWAFELDERITALALWDSDLWAPMLRGLRDAELTLDDWKCILNRIARHEFHSGHASEISQLLYAIVRDGGKSFALELLEQANNIAFDLWNSLSHEDEEAVKDWLSTAINRPAGVLMEFWINGLSLLLHEKYGDERTLPDNYREWFTIVVQTETNAGGFGRSILASQVAFLFDINADWTRKYLIPLFSSPDTKKFSQSWDGFLVWGRLNTPLVDELMPAFLMAIPRLVTDLAEQRQRFIEFFTALAVFHVNDPTIQLLPELFKNGVLDDRINFASYLEFFLQQMDEAELQNLWGRWLNRYWKSRLDSVTLPLAEAEAKKMLGWLPHLGSLFPQGVSLATSAPLNSKIEDAFFLYEIQESDLVTQFPTETAELLIYLCPHVAGYQTGIISTIAQRFPPLAPELHHRLGEALAVIGLPHSEILKPPSL